MLTPHGEERRPPSGRTPEDISAHTRVDSRLQSGAAVPKQQLTKASALRRQSLQHLEGGGSGRAAVASGNGSIRSLNFLL